MIPLAADADSTWPVAIMAGVTAVIVVLFALGARLRPRRDEETRRMVAELGELVHRLEGLVRDADERIETLRRLTGESPETTAKPQVAGPEGDSTRRAAEDPLTRRVYELSDTGRDAAQIARETSEHIGKVELILALRDR